MSCQNLMLKHFKLLKPRLLNCRSVQSYISNVTYCYSSVFSNQILNHTKLNNSRHFPSLKFHTSQIYSESSEEEDLTKPLVKMTFITHEGEKLKIQGRVGMTVMQAAVKNSVPMEAACEGQLACTTCHVYVEEGSKFKEATTEEEDLLDSAPFCRPNSRLSCQLKITEELKNVTFKLPAATSNFSVDGKAQKHS